VTEEFDENRKMSDAQLRLLNKMGNQYNVNLISMFKDQLGLNPARLTIDNASKGIKLLHKYQADTSIIPDSIRGFDEDWRG
jgi:hypothetical protein